ncbi:hypothetical protein D3C80_2096980 [compost metagenome]
MEDFKVTLKQINLSKADIESVKRGAGKLGELDIYAVSETTKKVYYVQGYISDGKTYYTLNDELSKLIGINKLK